MKVLFFDIETSNLAANFGYMLCLGYKWGGQKRTKIISIRNSPTFEDDPTNDLYILEQFRPVVEEADILVGHYSTRFDYPFIQTRCLFHGVEPFPTDAKHIDTWRIARNRLKFNSNRLASLAAHIGAGEKTIVDGRAWVKGMAGHIPSLRYIEEHCKIDVEVLERVYAKIAAFRPTTSGPKLAVNGNCPTCGSTNIIKRGLVKTVKRRTQRFSCNDCGHWFQA